MPQVQFDTRPRFVRITDRDRSLADILGAAAASGLPVVFLPADRISEDGAAVDPTLAAQPGPHVPPAAGTTFAGLTPAQRHAFLDWAMQPDTPAPPAFHQLYVANLEVRLLESANQRTAALRQLTRLASTPSWQTTPWAGRAVMLGFWLTQDGPGLAAWLAEGHLPASLLGVALGLQARLGTALTPAELGGCLRAWNLSASEMPPDLLKLRLASLTSSLGAEPLAFALAQLGHEAAQSQPWRCAHRGLRLALPQPDLRPILEQPLADMLVVADVDREATAPVDSEHQSDQSGPWQLILEFGHSRSDFFSLVLARCQRLPGYAQILDEDRKMVYRVTFTRSELRRFWQIWDYAQGWASTRVYLNGEELEKWKIWPYSQYLR